MIRTSMKTAVATGLGMVVCIVCVALIAVGCSNRGFEIGPFTFEFPAIQGEQLNAAAISALDGETDEEDIPFSDLPSEAELQELMREAAGGFDVSQFVSLTRIRLNKTTLTATQGDFGVVSGLAVYYVPADGGNEVLLGRASSASGFGTEIVLNPEDTVDFLELVRANDAFEGDGSPVLRVEIQGLDVEFEEETIYFNANVSLAVSARVTVFGGR